MSQHKPKLVCFSCKFGWGYLTSEETISSEIENWIPIICTGKIDVTHIINAFKQGADGVLILGCPEGDCHYQDGNYEAKKRVYLVRKLLDSIGISKERIKIELSIDPDGKRIPQLVREMNKELMRLGPLKPLTRAEKTAKEVTKVRGGK